MKTKLSVKLAELLAQEDPSIVEACTVLSMYLIKINQDTGVDKETFVEQMDLCWDSLAKIDLEDHTLQ